MQSATHLAHKSSLSVRCLFSISFVWILGTRVIHFKVKTRQRDQKKKKAFLSPRSSFQTSPGIPNLLLAGRRPRAGQHAREKGLGQTGSCRREVSSGSPPPCHSLCAGSQFCSQWDLYLTPRVLDREHRRKGRVSSPSFHPVSFTPSTLGTTRV